MLISVAYWCGSTSGQCAGRRRAWRLRASASPAARPRRPGPRTGTGNCRTAPAGHTAHRGVARANCACTGSAWNCGERSMSVAGRHLPALGPGQAVVGQVAHQSPGRLRPLRGQAARLAEQCEPPQSPAAGRTAGSALRRNPGLSAPAARPAYKCPSSPIATLPCRSASQESMPSGRGRDMVLVDQVVHPLHGGQAGGRRQMRRACRRASGCRRRTGRSSPERWSPGW